jgi:hypothetical protein
MAFAGAQKSHLTKSLAGSKSDNTFDPDAACFSMPAENVDSPLKEVDRRGEVRSTNEKPRHVQRINLC